MRFEVWILAARTLGLWVWIPLGARKYTCVFLSCAVLCIKITCIGPNPSPVSSTKCRYIFNAGRQFFRKPKMYKILQRLLGLSLKLKYSNSIHGLFKYIIPLFIKTPRRKSQKSFRNRDVIDINSLTFYFTYLWFAVSNSFYVEPIRRKINKWWIGKDVKETSCCLIWGTIQAFTWKNWRKSLIILVTTSGLSTKLRIRNRKQECHSTATIFPYVYPFHQSCSYEIHRNADTQ